MKYLDILKNYDKAIVTESKKLEKIYNSLVNEDGNSNPEDKAISEFGESEEEEGTTEETPTPKHSGKMQSSEEFYGQDAISKDDFFADANAESENDDNLEVASESEEEGEGKSEEVTPAEEPEEEDTEEGGEEDAETQPSQDDNEVQPQETTDGGDEGSDEGSSEGGEKSSVTTAAELFGEEKCCGNDCNGQVCEKLGKDCSNAREWLGSLAESEDTEKKEQPKQKEPAEEEPKEEEPENEEPVKSPKSPKPTAKKPSEDEENDEENSDEEDSDELESLKESTEAIRQFVRANRKLFYTEK